MHVRPGLDENKGSTFFSARAEFILYIRLQPQNLAQTSYFHVLAGQVCIIGRHWRQRSGGL